MIHILYFDIAAYSLFLVQKLGASNSRRNEGIHRRNTQHGT